MPWKVKVDGVTVREFENKESAEQHARNINSQLLIYDNEAYVESSQ